VSRFDPGRVVLTQQRESFRPVPRPKAIEKPGTAFAMNNDQKSRRALDIKETGQ
jgi:hypothetical protein